MKLIQNALLSMIMLLMVALPVMATDVEVVPENQTVENGSQFNVGIDIRNSTNVSSISFNLGYDNNTIKYDSHNISDFFEEVDITNKSVLEDNNSINISANESVNGDGRLIDLTFNATEDNSTSEFNVSNFKINGSEASANITNRSVEVAPELYMTTITDGINRISNPFQENVSEGILREQCPGIMEDTLEVYEDGSFTDANVMETEKAYRIDSLEDCDIRLSGMNYDKNKNFTSVLSSGINWIGTTYNGINSSTFYDRCEVNGNITTLDENGDMVYKDSNDILERGKAYKMNLSYSCDINAQETYEVNMIEYDRPNVLQGKINETNFTLENAGNRETEVNISVQNFEDSQGNVFSKDNISLSKDSVSLDIHEEKEISITFNASLDQTPGEYDGYIVIEYEDETKPYSVEVEVDELTKEISIESVEDLIIHKNRDNEFNVGMENTGTGVIDEINATDFNLTNGNDTIETNVSVNKSSLDPNEETNITIEANASGVEKGDYSGNLTVNYDGKSKNKTIDVEVDEINRSVNIEYLTPTIKEGENLTHQFFITNDGNIDLENISADLSNLTDGNDSINVELSNVSSLGTGESETVDLNASTNIGQVGNYSNNLTVEYDGETTEEEINIIVETLIGSVNISMKDDEDRSIRGVNLSNWVEIANDGPRDLPEVNVSVSNLSDNGDSIEVNTEGNTSFGLDKEENERINLTYIIPEDISIEEYNGSVSVEFQNQSINKNFSLNVEEKQRNSSFTNPQIDYFIGRDTQAETTMNVTNTGNVETKYNLSVTDLERYNEVINSSKISLSNESFELESEENKEITLSVEDLDNYSQGTYNGNVNISYKNNTEQADFTINIDEAQHGINVPGEIFIDNKERGSSVSMNFTVENAGDFESESLSISHNIDNKYNASVTPESVTVTQDDDASVELEFDIPGDESFDRHKIGNINLNNTNINKNVGVYLEPIGGLEINNLEVSVDGDDEDVVDGEKVSEEALPGDEIEFDFEIENKLREMEIEDVFVEIDIDNIDSGSDIDLETDEKDIDEEDEEDFKLNFDVPYLVDAKTYDVEIYAEGDDEEGNLHNIYWTIQLEVEKDGDHIVVDDIRLSPQEISCSYSTNLKADIINAGEDDEDDMRVTIENSDLGINIEEEFDLEEGDDEDDSMKELSEDLDIPENAQKKSHLINLNVYSDNDDLEESELLTLNVKECDSGDETVDEEEQESEDEQTEEDFVVEEAPEPEQPSEEKEEKKKEGIRESDLYLPVLGAVAAGLGVLILALIPK